MRLIGLWSEPEDIDAFEHDYLGSHFPRLNGLVNVEAVKTSRCIDGPYYRMTELTFRSLDDMQSALDTDEGRTILEQAHALAQKYGNRLEVLVVAEAN